MLDNLKKIGGFLSAIGGVVLLVWGGFEFKQRTHTDPNMVQEAEEFFQTYDEKKAYGEYIMDSIEEVNTQKRWEEQQKVNAQILEGIEYTRKEMKHMDSLRRLDSDQIYQIKQEFKKRHN